MKPILRKVDAGNDYTFRIREDILPYLYNHWHYHPEAELTFIRRSSGTRLVGDHMERFGDGDLVLLGPNLPHMWRNDDLYFHPGSRHKSESIAVHFLPECLGKTFLHIPEMKPVRLLLEDARRGIRLTGGLHDRIRHKMEVILHAKGVYRVTSLLEMLYDIACSNEKLFLSSLGFTQSHSFDRVDKINEIYHYTFNNFTQPVSIEEAARSAHISPHSFCRYFKTRTSKTYIRFLTEIRVGHACKLILENSMSIAQVCYASGFNNLSNFNRRFKEITGKTPLEYYRIFSDRKTG
ncbi:helix-turn-helix protein [Anseongella ginsenosidimutans]|uniref:Helix-turn-helix protein n=1 Tax=Anseongella ginsenosidimutans TaxID=496056 RepID=A0A4R3KSJ9_9SPHI|nr:AraC family transcriptional regulator [Anseongella ginsenosidimutans]QEC53310.1 helix-turn-helix domain-containing protein [Anseongella ginsenosidimutans]TCS88186.1 helix-turn-helix protein [Anseongella ginsenosidimutans]